MRPSPSVALFVAAAVFWLLGASHAPAQTIYAVTNTNDAGPGSLRQALLDSQGGGFLTITFNIPGGGVKKIAPLTRLPNILNNNNLMILDGTSQPGWSVGNPVIELSGENLVGTDGIGLFVSTESIPGQTSRTVVRGLIINRFTQYGIWITEALNLSIEGCFIGTDATGTSARPNGLGIIAQAVARNLENITIGGNTPAQRNIISGNRRYGIQILGRFSGGDTCFVRGNFVGTDKTGTFAIPNNVGVALTANGASEIGGATAAEGNVVSGNVFSGLDIGGRINLIRNNRIGVAADGVAPLGNERGVSISNRFGYTTSGENLVSGNIIAFHRVDGVTLYGNPTVFSSGNQILGNSIHSNGALGIELDFNSGVAVNDPGDADTGSNHLQNYPVLTSAIVGSTTTTVLGTLGSEPSTSYRIEFFASDRNAREGKTLLGAQNVTTNAAGDATINAALGAVAYFGQFITATATRSVAPLDTSEFSAAIPVTLTTFTVTNTNNAGAGSLRQAILDANASPDPNEIRFAITPLNATTKTINLTSALPAITQPVAINGLSQPAGAVIELNGTGAGASTHGLSITADHVLVQGLVLNRFGGSGIFLSGSDQSTLQNNKIGTNATGAGASANGADGIFLSNSSGNRILNNTLSGNTGAGLRLTNAANNVVQDNVIGLDARQSGVLPNAGGGVVVSLASTGNLIGGSGSGEGNVIAGNAISGLTLTGAGANNNRIVGNAIGTTAAGTVTTFGNQTGITLAVTAANNTIGGTGAGEGNLIAENDGVGVLLAGTAGNGNRILGNRFSGNRTAAIDLNGDGITANDAGDGDSGPNRLQNFPVLTSAGAYFGGLTVTGTLNSTASADYRIELFSNPTCESSGNGEGQTFLGAFDTATDAAGTASFSQTLLLTVPLGQVITATATALATGDTSEFSACRTVTVLTFPALVVTNTNDSGAGSLRQALLDANAANSPRQINFNIPSSGVQTITPATSFPVVTSAVVIDGLTQPGASSATPLIELNGSAVPSPPNVSNSHGLQLAGSGSIQGLVINRFKGDGLRFETLGNNVVKSCRIGTDPTGLIALGNNRSGINLEGVSDNVIGGPGGEGNLISANARLSVSFGGNISDAGIRGFLSSNNRIQGNIIGPTLTGGTMLAGRKGINLTEGSGNLIGGPTPTERNVVNNTTMAAVTLANSSDNTVQGNYIGLDLAGLANAGITVGEAGIRVQDAPDNRILGNVASNTRASTGRAGIHVSGGASSGTVITGNRIGTNASGTGGAGNFIGIFLTTGAEAQIGGNTAAERNIISGNDTHGILLSAEGVPGNPPQASIRGNTIGLGADGSTVLANGIGIEVGIDVPNVQVGATGFGNGNVISGNGTGLLLASAGNVVQANLIGTDLTGTLARGNGTGLRFAPGATGNLIGGTSASARNVFAASTSVAITTAAGATTAGGHTIQRNLLGTATDGLSPLGNALGIQLDSGGNTISDNTIAFNSGRGVVILATGTGNRISRNAIFSNSGLGIDLGNDGVTANDLGDADTGANNRQNFPLVTSAGNTVRGSLNSLANTVFALQFFLTPSGSGQGRTLLGETIVTTSASGNLSFIFTPTLVPVPLPFGQIVTATATDPNGNTSEFSAPVAVHLSYEGWAAANGIPGEAREGDFDLDGIPNVVEYALGLNPIRPNVLPSLLAEGGSLLVRFNKGPEAALDPDILYRFQTSTDLRNWSSDLFASTEDASVAEFKLPGGETKQFVRLVIVSP